jgi:DNA-binding MarR family transcriptional regulator
MTRARSQSGAPPDRADLEREALLATRSLVDRMRTLYRELEQLTGAPISMHRAMLCIGEEPGLAASELARRLGMKRPAVSQLLRSLSSRGWIERVRDTEDNRSVKISPTPEGRQLLRLTSGRAVGTLKRAVHSLATEDIGHLARGLGALLATLPPETPVDSGTLPRIRKSPGKERRRDRKAAAT